MGGSSVASNNTTSDEIPALESQTETIVQSNELAANDDLGHSESRKPSEVEKKNPLSARAGGALKLDLITTCHRRNL